METNFKSDPSTPYFANVDRQFYIENRKFSTTKTSYSFHYHEAYEIYYLINGTRKYCINNKHYDINEPALVFVKPNIIHATYGLGYSERELIHFNTKVINKYFNTRIKEIIGTLFENNIYTTKIEDKKQYLNYFKLLHDDYNKIDDDSFAYHLLGFLLFVSRNTTPIKENNTTINTNKYINYINNNFEKDESLDEIAQKLYISKYYLCHIFKKEVGVSISNYKLQQKIVKSVDLLINTDLKIKDIANECGFNSETFFCRSFHSIMKTTPTKFRININTQEREKNPY